MKALIFVHLSSGSVSRKLGCLEYKTYGRKNHSFRFTLVIFTNENDVRLRKSEYIQCNYFLSNIGSSFIQKRNFSYTVCYHVKNAHNIYQPCNLTLLRSIYIVSFFLPTAQNAYISNSHNLRVPDISQKLIALTHIFLHSEVLCRCNTNTGSTYKSSIIDETFRFNFT